MRLLVQRIKDFRDSALKTASVIRISRLAVIEREILNRKTWKYFIIEVTANTRKKNQSGYWEHNTYEGPPLAKSKKDPDRKI